MCKGDKSCNCGCKDQYNLDLGTPLTFGDGGYISKKIVQDLDQRLLKQFPNDPQARAAMREQAMGVIRQMAYGGLTNKQSGSQKVDYNPDAAVSNNLYDQGLSVNKVDTSLMEGTTKEKLKDVGRIAVNSLAGVTAGTIDAVGSMAGFDTEPLTKNFSNLKLGEMDEGDLKLQKQAGQIGETIGATFATVAGGIATGGNPTVISRGADQAFEELGQIDPNSSTLNTISTIGRGGSQLYGNIASAGTTGGFSEEQLKAGAGLFNPEDTQALGNYLKQTQGVSQASGLQGLSLKYGGLVSYANGGPGDPPSSRKKLPTLYVDRNDPAGVERYQAYQDSLLLHNNTIGSIKALQDAKTAEEWRSHNPDSFDPSSQAFKDHVAARARLGEPKPKARFDKDFGPSMFISPVSSRYFTQEYYEPVQPVKYGVNYMTPLAPKETSLPQRNLAIPNLPRVSRFDKQPYYTVDKKGNKILSGMDVWDERTKSWKRREVTPEEIQYYSPKTKDLGRVKFVGGGELPPANTSPNLTALAQANPDNNYFNDINLGPAGASSNAYVEDAIRFSYGPNGQTQFTVQTGQDKRGNPLYRTTDLSGLEKTVNSIEDENLRMAALGNMPGPLSYNKGYANLDLSPAARRSLGKESYFGDFGTEGNRQDIGSFGALMGRMNPLDVDPKTLKMQPINTVALRGPSKPNPVPEGRGIESCGPNGCIWQNQAGGPISYAPGGETDPSRRRRRKKDQKAPITVSEPGPEWVRTGPGLMVDGKLYQSTELTGNTLIPTDPVTGEQIPILLPEATVYPQEDPITKALRRTGTGLLGSTIDKNQYNEVGDRIRDARNDFTLNALSATGDIMGKPQQYLINAPLALATGQKPNLSMFPTADKLRGINNGPAYPSETFGITNPYGAFAVDFLTDPSIVFNAGVGLSRKLPAAGKYLTRQTPKQLPGSSVASSVDDVGRVLTQVPQIPKPSWQMQELPGLHLKSTMSDGPISKIVEPKTGLVNVEQALGIIGKESGGANKVALIKQGLGNNIPKKMDYNEFRKVVQDQLIPLETKINPRGASEYGLHSIGYEDAPPMDMGSVTFSNKAKFGRGSSAHNNPDETLGHAHFFRDAETPDVLTVTQIQSDAFQGTHRIMPKTQQEALEKVSKLKEEGVEIKSMFGDGKESSNSVLAHYEKNLQLDEASAKNFTQKQLLDKNHQERYLQELVDYAGKRGDVNKVRVPTSETAAKVQGYETKKRWNINRLSNGDNVVLANGLEGTVIDDTFRNATTIATKDGKEIIVDMSTAGYGASKTPSVKFVNNTEVKEISTYSDKQLTILKKYSEQPKTIKKLFGAEPKVVTDSKGNTWYEFDIPKKFKEGKGEIKAFNWGVPAAIGAGTAAAVAGTQKAYGGPTKYQTGGPISYANGGDTDPPRRSIINRNVDIRPQTYYSVAESTGTQAPVFQSREDVEASGQKRFFNQTVQEADRVAAITGNKPNYKQAQETVTTGKQPTFVTNPDDPEYQKRAKAYRDKYGIEIDDPSVLERLANPMAQLEYYNRYGSFPNRAQMDLDPTYGNPFDIALGIYNPASYIQSGLDAADAASKGNYGEAALSSLGVIPGYYGYKLAGNLAGKYAPGAFKFLDKLEQGVDPSYAKDLIYSLRRNQIPTFKTATRWEPDEIPEFLKRASLNLTDEQKALKGSWYGYRPDGSHFGYFGNLGFYPATRKGPGNLYTLRLSNRQIANLEKSMPASAKGMSGKAAPIPSSNSYLQGELIIPEQLRKNAKAIRMDINPSEYGPSLYKNTLLEGLDPSYLTGKFLDEVVLDPVNNLYLADKIKVPKKYIRKTGGPIDSANPEQTPTQPEKIVYIGAGITRAGSMEDPKGILDRENARAYYKALGYKDENIRFLEGAGQTKELENSILKAVRENPQGNIIIDAFSGAIGSAKRAWPKLTEEERKRVSEIIMAGGAYDGRWLASEDNFPGTKFTNRPDIKGHYAHYEQYLKKLQESQPKVEEPKPQLWSPLSPQVTNPANIYQGYPAEPVNTYVAPPVLPGNRVQLNPPDFRYGGGLRRWFKEDWTDVKTGEPCGRESASDSSRPYPYCRPANKVSSKTPATTKHPEAKKRARSKTGPTRVKPITR